MELGSKVRIKTTGVEGIVAAKSEELHGAPLARVEYKSTTGTHCSDWIAQDGLEPTEAPIAGRPFPGSGDPGDPGPGAPDVEPKRETTE